jgi:deoxycytidylate deaminase
MNHAVPNQRSSEFPAVPGDAAEPVDLIAAAAGNFPHRPSWDEYFMATAVLMSSRSNCERLHVGCVIVTGGERKNRIVAAGYNGFLPGTPHVSRVRAGHEQATVHAEQNAVADAARRGSSVEGCVAYGLTAAYFGENTIRDGRIAESNFNDYTLLGLADMPRVEAVLVPSGGFWGGMGEPPMAPLAPALVNALFAATGRRIRSLPLRSHGFLLA